MVVQLFGNRKGDGCNLAREFKTHRVRQLHPPGTSKGSLKWPASGGTANIQGLGILGLEAHEQVVCLPKLVLAKDMDTSLL
jgi:hypothetical protein